MSETNAPQVPPLTRPEMGLTGLAALAAAGVGVLGLASSFAAVSEAAARWEFAAPWMLPIGIDIAIPVFTVANLLLIRMDMRLAWVRFVPWALTLVTCGLNVAAGTSTAARFAHGTMPLLWVVFSEIVAHIYAVRIGAVTGRRMEKIRRSRWLLAPLSTFVLWRRMTLWELTSYADALTLERDRLLARADLRETHGRRWRTRTPRRQRVLLKLGELAPAAGPGPAPEPPAGRDAVSAPGLPELPPAAPADPAPHPSSSRPAARKPRAKARKTVRSADELLTEARKATAGWTDRELTAERIRTALHTSQASARALRETLRAERTTTSTGPVHTLDTAPAAVDTDQRGEGAEQGEGVAA